MALSKYVAGGYNNFQPGGAPPPSLYEGKDGVI